ncbi:hypothetical protein [Streptomyces sp. NPDC054887]
MGCLAFLLAVLTGTAETEHFSHLYDAPRQMKHRFTTADQALGASPR